MKAWKSKHGAEVLKKYGHRAYEYVTPWRIKMESRNTGSITFCAFNFCWLFVVALKLFGVIGFSWWLVLFPYYAAVAIPFILVITIITFAFAWWLFYGIWLACCFIYQLIRDAVRYTVGW